MAKKTKTPVAWLAVAVTLIMVGSVLANFVNTSFGKVSVTQITIPTDKGVLSGLLYLPAGAGPASPRPAIVVTHGYLNAKEMQAAPAIEMSRRGFVVLALDCYAHGDSFLNKVPKGGEFMSYWPPSVYDAVKYIYGQSYVLKDKNGDGIIAVSGHSMGGFSSTMAMAFDEREYQKNLQEGKKAVRMIRAVLSVGADYLWTSYLGVDGAAADKLYANRIVGTIAAQFDEFFFDVPAERAGKTMVKKDYIHTDVGRAFLRNPPDPQLGVFYPTADFGQRVIYQPFQTHPWNHISIRTTRNMIDFYGTAFSPYAESTTAKSGQIWLLKELMETIALVGYFLLFSPLVQLLTRIPWLKHAVTEPLPEFSGPATPVGTSIFWVIAAFSTVVPALLYITCLNKAAAGLGPIKIIALVVFALAIVGLVVALIRKNAADAYNLVVTAVGAFVLFGFAAGASNLFLLDSWYNSPVTNNVVYWALMVTTVTFVVLSIGYQFLSRPFGTSLKQYGFLPGWKSLLPSLVVAVIAAAVGFVIAQLVGALFKTDFRLWLVVVRAFNKEHLVTAFRYMPLLFLYFLVNGVALHVNTNSAYLKGAKGYWVALLMNVGGLVGWMAIQYGSLFASGTAAFVTQALNSIVLIGLTVNLGIATVITKKCLDKTNNVYTGAFLNTIVITVMTIASSTMYWSLVK
jgi:alpha-beta hydrolase superfamily lysophospholipase